MKAIRNVCFGLFVSVSVLALSAETKASTSFCDDFWSNCISQCGGVNEVCWEGNWPPDYICPEGSWCDDLLEAGYCVCKF